MKIDLNELRVRLTGHVNVLAEVIGDRSGRRITAHQAARAYLVRELESMGCTVRRDPYETPIREAENLEVVLPGTDHGRRPLLVVGAHYDTAPGTPGADDNASAVAVLLEIARVLVDQTKRRRTVRLVCFDCEEPPFFATSQMGSHRHAKQCHERGDRVLGMICLESLGYFLRPGAPGVPCDGFLKRLDRFFGGKHITLCANRQSTAFFLRVLWCFAASGFSRLVPAWFPRGEGLISLSDNRNYWAHGFPAVMFTDTTFLRNPNYHLSTDRLATLDLNRMTRLAAQMIRCVARLS